MHKYPDQMTASAYIKMQNEQGRKPSKYKNEPVVYDGITFDSKFECERYKQLKLFERAKLIRDLVLQPVFELQPSFRYQGKAVRAIKYVGDFQYVDCATGKTTVEDTKGFQTKEFELKAKLLKFKYPDIDFRLVKK